LTILGNTLALLLVLSVLVVVHEFGHFAVAKAFHFPVEVFSFGFGKRLFGKKINGTDYRVSAIPLGGYVRVVGLGPDESTITEGSSREAQPVGKRWQRALILLAGPGMNVVLAFLFYTCVFALGVKVPAVELAPAVVRRVEPGSPGAEAGFQPGDRILSIDGTPTPTWRDARFLFQMNARETLSVRVERGGSIVPISITPVAVSKYDLGYVGLAAEEGRAVHPRVERVISGGPAAKAGIKVGDVIPSIAGRSMEGPAEKTFESFVAAIKSAAPGPFPVEISRDGKRSVVFVKPRPEGQAWKLDVGVAPDEPEVLERFPIGQSFVEAWRQVEKDFRMTLSVLSRLFRGRASLKTMSGPLDIAKFSGEAARTGAVPLVALMATISLQLGIFNLLPIPVLDGGHLFLLAIEGAARRDFSLRVKERILQLGFLMILALLSVVLYNDLSKNLPAKWWPF
jgi:regulator of sigma E protease